MDKGGEIFLSGVNSSVLRGTGFHAMDTQLIARNIGEGFGAGKYRVVSDYLTEAFGSRLKRPSAVFICDGEVTYSMNGLSPSVELDETMESRKKDLVDLAGRYKKSCN